MFKVSVAARNKKGRRCGRGIPMMKSFCSLLIVIVSMHAACAGRCLGSRLSVPDHNDGAAPAPPCHKAANTPAPEKPANQEEDRACAQASVFDSKLKGAPHFVSFEAAMPAVSAVVILDDIRRAPSMIITPLDTSPLASSLSILRS